MRHGYKNIFYFITFLLPLLRVSSTQSEVINSLNRRYYILERWQTRIVVTNINKKTGTGNNVCTSQTDEDESRA